MRQGLTCLWLFKHSLDCVVTFVGQFPLGLYKHLNAKKQHFSKSYLRDSQKRKGFVNIVIVTQH